MLGGDRGQRPREATALVAGDRLHEGGSFVAVAGDRSEAALLVSPWHVGQRAPGAAAELHDRAGRHERSGCRGPEGAPAAALGQEEQPLAALRHAQAARVDHDLLQVVVEREHGGAPDRVEHPLAELGHVLDSHVARPVDLGGRDDRPGGGAIAVVGGCAAARREGGLPGAARALAPSGLGAVAGGRLAVPLAGRRGPQEVVVGDLVPVGLVEILADVERMGVVGAVDSDGQLGMVAGPNEIEPGTGESDCGPAGATKQIGGLVVHAVSLISMRAVIGPRKVRVATE